MRQVLPFLVLASLFVAGCSDDDCPTCPAPSEQPASVQADFEELANWWATEGDVDVSAYETATITILLTNDTGQELDFSSEFEQIWTVPDVYPFQEGVDAEVVYGPTTVAPGGTTMFIIDLDLTSIPADQTGIAFRGMASPTGNVMPGEATIHGGVLFSP